MLFTFKNMGYLKNIFNAFTGKKEVSKKNPAGIELYGAGQYELGYAKKKILLREMRGWVFACTSAIADEIAQIDIKLYKRKGDKIEEVTDSPILDTLYKVNDFTTKFDHFWLTSAYLELTGESPWYLEKDASGVTGIFFLDPSKLTPIADKKTIISGYRYEVGMGKKITIPKENIIFIKFPDPARPFRGLGTLEAAARSVDVDINAEEWNSKFFENSARPDSILNVNVVQMDDEQKKVLKHSIEEQYKGTKKSQQLMVLFGDMKLEKFATTQKDMDFLEQQRFTRDKIFGIFRVPKAVLAQTEGVNYACHSEDTEVLTETGWKRYWNVGGEDLIACYDKDSNLISYEKPKDFILYKYKGKMHKYENKVTSMLVTPNHRMLWKPETKNAEFTTCLSEDLKNKWFRFKTNAKWKSVKELVSFIIPSYKSKMVNCPEKKVDVSKLMTLFGWYFSEGCSIYNQVRISQSDDKYADEIRKFLNSTGFEIIEFSDERRENTCRDFRIKHAGLANYLKQFGLKANEKVLPAWIKNLDSESIELFLDSFLKGDGSIDRNGHKIFYTSSKKMADDLQELVFKTGKKSSIKTIKSENKCDMYGVHVSERIVGESNPSEEETRLSQDENYSVEEYNDYVWCFDTPTGFFVTRRNGKIAIQGNSNVNKASLGEMRSEMYQDSFADELVVKKTIDEEIFATACRIKKPDIKDEDIPKFVFKKRKVEVSEELELKKLWSEIVINVTKAAKDLTELGFKEASKKLIDNIDDFNSENSQPIQALFEEKPKLNNKKKGWFSKK